MITKVPFERFILAFLILGKNLATIVEKLKEFHYYITEDEVSEIFEYFKSLVSERLRGKLECHEQWSLQDEQDVQWLKKMELYEFYDYLLRRNDKTLTEVPDYFKWFKDVLWVHSNEDVLALVNIFVYNGESLESISDIISFRYKKKLGIETLKRHLLIYWQCSALTCKEALYHCIPFRNNTLIIKNIKSAGYSEVTKLDDAATDGSDSSFIFNDSNYLKWKLNFPVKIPTTKDFMEKVKTDSYFKYQEAMNMSQSAEIIDEQGTDQFGAFDSKIVKRRNVEEQKARAAKTWLEMFLKADSCMPVEGSKKDDDFFRNMEALNVDYKSDKIISINDNPDILEDIKGNM